MHQITAGAFRRDRWTLVRVVLITTTCKIRPRLCLRNAPRQTLNSVNLYIGFAVARNGYLFKQVQVSQIRSFETVFFPRLVGG